MINPKIKDLAHRMPTQYLQNFFAEKDIQEEIFDVEGESGINNIPNTVVVEHFLVCQPHEIQGIENILRKIDLANGDVNHFLKHLAQALAK